MANKKGRFSKSEEAFIKQNYLSMSDKEIGDALNRDHNSIMQYRKRNSLNKKGVKIKPSFSSENEMKKKSYINNVPEQEKKRIFLEELRSTAQYRTTVKSLTSDEKHFYEERYLDFMMDPTVETMTSSEKDTLHRKTITEIRLLRFLEDEKTLRATPGSNANKSKEIQECQDTIYKCEKSLNVTREQRLKDGQDQSINFTNIIKELQDPNKRTEIGYEAAMLKYRAEKLYKERLNENIIAGDETPPDLDDNFIENS